MYFAFLNLNFRVNDNEGEEVAQHLTPEKFQPDTPPNPTPGVTPQAFANFGGRVGPRLSAEMKAVNMADKGKEERDTFLRSICKCFREGQMTNCPGITF